MDGRIENVRFLSLYPHSHTEWFPVIYETKFCLKN